MHFVIAGATGFLGTRARPGARLARPPGHRADPAAPTAAGRGDAGTRTPASLDQDLVERRPTWSSTSRGRGCSATRTRRSGQRALRESRVGRRGCWPRRSPRADRPPAFLANNATAYYGDHGDEVVTEATDSRGDAFMTRVTRDWQAAADPAVAAGSRVCILRTAPVMAPASDAAEAAAAALQDGLGTRIGDGRQCMPVISRCVTGSAWSAPRRAPDAPRAVQPVLPGDADQRRVHRRRSRRTVHRSGLPRRPRRAARHRRRTGGPGAARLREPAARGPAGLGLRVRGPGRRRRARRPGWPDRSPDATRHRSPARTSTTRRCDHRSRGSGWTPPDPAATAAPDSRSVTSITIRPVSARRTSAEATCIRNPVTRSPRST